MRRERRHAFRCPLHPDHARLDAGNMILYKDCYGTRDVAIRADTARSNVRKMALTKEHAHRGR